MAKLVKTRGRVLATPQVQSFIALIRKALPGTEGIDQAVQAVRSDVGPLVGFTDQLDADLEVARLALHREHEITILRRSSIFAKRPDWYHGPRPGDHHWPALRSYFLDAKKWDSETVESINSGSNEIVSLLANPLEDQFSYKGLVVGYVQSGKTANMTAVISKAVDRGYNLILVFAGLTDKLRQQTQRRLESDIVKRQPTLWQRLTTADIKGEFQTPAHGHLSALDNRVQLAVMKKNTAPLQRLLNVIEETPAAEMRKIRVLIIDDECDQASVNAAAQEMDISKINEKIRLILEKLPTVSYVGYTATPFANVLINPYADQTETLDDLYPKDFITSLELPKGYFGTQKLFGRTPADPSSPLPEEEGLDVIRPISEEDEAALQPASRAAHAGFVPSMTDSLRDAVLYYIATCAVRRARGHSGEHMTMLVHTSPAVRMHQTVANLIENWLGAEKPALEKLSGATFDALKAVWELEQTKLPADITDARQVSFEELSEQVPGVLRDLAIVIENGSSDDRIDYIGDPKIYIVVGGSILARGLTLEGLAVSYFLRTSNQYDTLLQMGRWFGYRHGYEDLPRLWMPDELKFRFRALAAIEAEIRDDISNYSQSPSVTPMDFAVRIRSVPGMAIVARNKMRHAQQCSIGYWGRHIQTLRFRRSDDRLLDRNWRAGAELVSFAARLGKTADIAGRQLFTDVPKNMIVQFLRSYTIDDSHQDLKDNLLLQFVGLDDPALQTWNVGVVEKSDGSPSDQPLGDLGPVKTVQRSRLADKGEIADIKALMSKADAAFDCKPGTISSDDDWEAIKAKRRSEVGDRPLLLLYPISRTSPAKTGSSSRIDLDAARDILGFGIVMPGSREAGGRYVSVTLTPPTPEELERIEAEEMDALEAAGVPHSV
jgi:hypothetical protein